MRTNLDQAYIPPEEQALIQMGQRVAVFGAGHAAVDCARMAVRLGAQKVTWGKTFATALAIVTLCSLIAPAAWSDGPSTELRIGPDVRPYYTSALDELGVTYDVWDVATQGDPSTDDLIGYRIVIWFTGYPRDDTFTSANEAAVTAYLDAQGRFWLVSEDYLYDRGLTSFGHNRLRIASYTNDVNRTDLEGVAYSPGAGLGPYNLIPPDGWSGDLYTDDVVRWSG